MARRIRAVALAVALANSLPHRLGHTAEGVPQQIDAACFATWVFLYSRREASHPLRAQRASAAPSRSSGRRRPKVLQRRCPGRRLNVVTLSPVLRVVDRVGESRLRLSQHGDLKSFSVQTSRRGHGGFAVCAVGGSRILSRGLANGARRRPPARRKSLVFYF